MRQTTEPKYRYTIFDSYVSCGLENDKIGTKNKSKFKRLQGRFDENGSVYIPKGKSKS